MSSPLIMSDGIENHTGKLIKGLDEYASDEELALVPLFVNYPDALLNFAAACCFIFLIIGFLGNTITIAALSKYKKVHNATAFFIINLSVSDLLFTITIYPISIALFLNKSWTTGRIMCQIFPALKYAFVSTSAFTIMAITINRYIMVIHPLIYPKLYQMKYLVIMIIAIWIGAFGTNTLLLLEIWGRFSLDPRMGFCTAIADKKGNSPKIVIIVTALILPGILIILCYSRILYIVKKSSSKATSEPQIKHTQSDSNQEATRELSISGDSQVEDNVEEVEPNASDALTKFKKNFKTTFRVKKKPVSSRPTRRDQRLQTMIIAIVISFFGCHLPIIIAKIANKEFAVGPYGNIMGYLFLYLTVCSNPIIYVVMSKEYRQAYRILFTRN